MYIVSACLLGQCCRYNGVSQASEETKFFLDGKSYIAVCPEVDGGLSVPRAPSEVIGKTVRNQKGEDVTEAFEKGAHLAYDAALKEALRLGEVIDMAILKAKSPSCGSKEIYDGTFQGRLVPGAGLFTKLLREKGIKVISEEDLIKR